jgi:thymidine kinase
MNPYGHLTVICGPMFAGKTTSLIQIATQAEATVFKPAFDTRYAVAECVSHDGECIKAHAIASLKDIAEVGDTKGPYCIDEAQFFDEDRYDGDFVDDLETLLSHGIDIYVVGLDLMANGKPFPVMSRLLAMADSVSKISANCHICKGRATKTFRRDGSSLDIDLGADDLYEARCNQHWK